ncbi:hypothetical protein AB0I81_40145 [Nonomuraea sp. NPDC050404]|uniref:hypothetical protein n=1 Tax=Nonomuraea sp. NPDC050404 TaxID=3155783 RepID=UPI0033F53CB3
MSPTPAIGRIVHYVSRGSADGQYPSLCRAAFVTQVDTYQDGPDADGQHIGHVGLAVFNPEGIHFNRTARQDETEHRGGTWHWPEGSPAAAQAGPVDLPALAAGVRKVHEIQGRAGNWDYDAYQRGLYNGLELAVSILDGDRKPDYRDAPPEGYRSERASSPPASVATP